MRIQGTIAELTSSGNVSNFLLRAKDGQATPIQTSKPLPFGIRAGDMVEVVGEMPPDPPFLADSVVRLNDNLRTSKIPWKMILSAAAACLAIVLIFAAVAVLRTKPTPSPASTPSPVAGDQPKPPPIEKSPIVVPRIVGGTLHDAIIAVAQKRLTPIIHLIAPRRSAAAGIGAIVGGVAGGSRPREKLPARDEVIQQFPPEGTVVEGGTAVLITTETDDPVKVGTFIEMPLVKGTPQVIDGSVARRMAGMPEPSRPPQ